MNSIKTIPEKIMIIEEHLIVGFDLLKQLQKLGYSVAFVKTIDDIIYFMKTTDPKIIITSFSILKRDRDTGTGQTLPEYINNLISEEIDLNRPYTFIICQNTRSLRKVQKPYNTADIVSYIQNNLHTINPAEVLC